MKSKKILKVLSVICALTFPASAFAGCGSFGSIQTKKSELTIRYYPGAYGKGWMETALKDFVNAKKAVGEKITYKLIPDEDITSSAVKHMESESGLADVYMLRNGPWTDWVNRGWLEPLTTVYDAEVETSQGKKKVKDYLSDGYSIQYYAQRRANQGDYFPWAMPWSASQIGLVYNEEILLATKHTTTKDGVWEVGDNWTAPPATVEDLLAYCTDLNAVDVVPFAFPGDEDHWFRYLMQIFWAQHQGVYEENTLNVEDGDGAFYDYWNMTEVDVLKQEGIQVGIDTVQDLFVSEKGGWKNTLSKVNEYDVQDAQEAFAVDKKTAMLLGGSFMYSEVKSLFENESKMPVMKMMNMPTVANAAKNADGSTMNINYYTSEDFMIVPKKSVNKELAKEFLALLCNEKYLLEFTKKTGTVRPFKFDDSVLDAEQLGFAANSFNASVLDVYKVSDIRLVSLPANITNVEERSLISLYKRMPLNGEYEWSDFMKDVKANKSSASIMADVYERTKKNFKDWMVELGVGV